MEKDRGLQSDALVKRPVFGLTLLLGLAVWGAEFLPHPAPFWLAGLLSLSGAALVKAPRARQILLWCGILCAFLSHAIVQRQPAADDLARQVQEERLHLPMVVELSGDPERLVHPVSGRIRVRVPARVVAARYRPEWQAFRGRVVLELPDDPALLPRPGERWTLDAALQRRDVAYPGLRSASFLASVRPDNLRRIEPGRINGFNAFAFRLKNHFSDRLHQAARDASGAGEVVQALLLGRRSDVDAAVMERFARTGTLHVFAVSGLHIGMLAGLVILLLRRMGVETRRWGWYVIPVLVLFTAFTGYRASAIRATSMVTCFLLAPCFWRRAHSGTALAFAAFVILLASPGQLFEIGFIYSFVLVAAILLLYGRFWEPLQERLRGDPWAPAELRQARWKSWFLLYPAGLLLMSLITFVASMPLTAAFFHLWSPVGLPGNMIVVPLAFLLVSTGFPALLLGLLSPTLAVWAAQPALFFAKGMLWTVEQMDRVPFGVQNVRAPQPWAVWACYLLPLAIWLWPQRRRALVALALGLAAFWGVLTLRESTRAEWVLVDAGRGQASWFQRGVHPPILVDGGDAWSAPYVIRDMKRDGVDRLAALILTHPDPRHLGAAESVLRTFPVRNLLLAQADLGHPACAPILACARERGVTLHAVQAGDRLELGGWTIDVLAPSASQSLEKAADLRSLVLRVSRDRAAILVQGGADERVEQDLLRRRVHAGARWLFAGHPSSKPACSEAFLAAVQPEAVFFAGEGFQGITRLRELSEARVLNAGIPLWRVPARGALRVFPDEARFRVE